MQNNKEVIEVGEIIAFLSFVIESVTKNDFLHENKIISNFNFVYF